MRDKISNWLLLLGIFLLPWQTQWIFSTSSINGGVSQYGRLSLFATQILFILVVFLRGRPQIVPEKKWVMQAGYFFLGITFFSLAFSHYFAVGMAQVLQVLFAFALFTSLCDRRTPYLQVLVAFISGLLIPSVLGWWQVLTGGSFASTWLGIAGQEAGIVGTAVVETTSGRLLRAYGSFPHPNIFGGFLAVALLMMAWLVRFIKTRRLLFLSVIPVVILSSTLILTFSRGAWLGVVLGFLTLLGLMLFRRRLIPSRAVPLMILGGICVMATLFFFHQQVFFRLSAQGRIEQISVTQRTSQYGQFFQVALQNPFLGVGPGAYPFALAQTEPGEKVWEYQPIHNVFFLVFAELGLLGFVALFYLLLRIDQVSAQFSKTAEGMIKVGLGVTLLVIGLFDHYLWSFWPGLALAVLSFSFMSQSPQSLISEISHIKNERRS